MKVIIENKENCINSVCLELQPVEFVLIRQILNLKSVYEELNTTDGQTAERMYKELNEQMKQTGIK